MREKKAANNWTEASWVGKKKPTDLTFKENKHFVSEEDIN